jgi:Cu+-exporting ATPase
MEYILEKPEVKCYHCGNECDGSDIRIDSKVFCCNGCKSVYEILDANLLCDYYQLETSNPGNKVEDNKKSNYAFLDEEAIVAKLLDFQEGDTFGVTFYIPSIHCSSCIWLLENMQKLHPGIITSSVQFRKKEITLQFNSKITLRQLAELLASLGYAPVISFNGKEINRKTLDKALLYKIGIAGFCFGNIMMLSLPEYLSVADKFSGDLKGLFTILSLLLSLPVFTYCSADYFASTWNAIKTRTVNIDLPIALGIIAAFSQSLYEIYSGAGSGYLDSLSGLVFFLLIGKWYQNKTYEALSFERDYKSYFPLAVTKIDNGTERYVTLDKLKAGDTILIRNKEIIPADGYILEGTGVIDYSFVTGESSLTTKETGQKVYAGGRQEGLAVKLILTKEVSESYLTQLWNKDNTTTKFDGLLEFTNKIGKYFTVAVLIISLGSYFFWVGKDPGTAIHAAVSVLIIFCPCIFALAIPFGFGKAMNILGRNGLFLKNTETIEKLAHNDAIVFDKTGTITTTKNPEVSFAGALSGEESSMVKALVKNSTHPLSRSIYTFLKDADTVRPDSFVELPSQGIKAIFNATEVIAGAAELVGMPKVQTTEMATGSRVYIKINDKVKGYFTFRNSYRKGFDKITDKLKKKYALHLLSGDNDSEKAYLSSYFPVSNLHFNQSPQDKLNYIKQLSIDQRVMMIGDGLNDAGALQQSNCGISITENSGNFSPACDAILDAAAFSRLPDFLRYAKACVQSVYGSLAISLSYNIIGLYFAVQGLLKPLIAAILMPISSVSVVLFVTVMSGLLAKKYKLR